MPVTAKDVATALNLSQPTVSRILSGDRGHRAAAGTRRRVLETAQRLGYQPNAVARSLRRGRTNVIGIHTNHDYDARNDFYGTIIGALQCCCRAEKLDLLLHSALHGSSAEAMYGKLRDGRIDGLILHASPNDPLVEILGQSSLPIVAVADSLPNITSVSCDDADGMRQLINWLWGRNFREFVMLVPETPLASVARRLEAYETALQLKGAARESAATVTINFEHAAPVLDQLVLRARSKGRPLAVCCWNDRTAYDLLRACSLRGISVPEELAVVGFDGFRDEKLPSRQLVTVNCPWEQVATTALQLLIARMEGRNDGDDNSSFSALPAGETILPVTLLEGDTA